jgi:hypothetical protein
MLKILTLHSTVVTIYVAPDSTFCSSTFSLLDASKEVGLEVNPEKTKCMLMSRSQKIGQRIV